MSKITPKNLHYDTTLPPFLARLQANNASRDGLNEFHVARPKKLRSAEDEAEDEPVYFNEESGETLTKSEWEAREAGAGSDGGGEAGNVELNNPGKKDMGEDAAKAEGAKESKEKIAGIGATKKRKAGKVVGGEDGEGSESVSTKRVQTSASNGESKKDEKAKPVKKTKAKKIKLSFDD